MSRTANPQPVLPGARRAGTLSRTTGTAAPAVPAPLVRWP